MRWKSTLVLLVLTVGLGAYVSLVELRRPTADQQRAKAKHLVRIPPETVTRLEVKFPQATAVLERHGAWRLVSPVQARADGSLIERILSQLDPFSAQRLLEPAPDRPLRLTDFGLDPPQATLSVTSDSGTMSLLFGEKTAVGSQRYAKRSDAPGVGIVSSFLFDSLDQPLASYRSRDALDFDSYQARRISVSWPQGRYALEQADAPAAQPRAWRLASPVSDLADQDVASAILGKLRELRIEQVITDEPTVEQVSKWGFDAPTAHVVLDVDGRAEPMELFVGRAVPDKPEQLYAKRKDEGSIYAVSKAAVDEVLKDPAQLRALAALDFLPAEVVTFRVEHGAPAWSAEQSDGQWKLNGGEAMDAAKVDDLLNRLRELRTIRFIDDGAGEPARYGLHSPSGSIELFLSARPEPLKLTLGVVEGNPRPYARVSGRGAVLELPESALELLRTAPESLKPAPAPAAAPPVTPPQSPSAS